MKLCVESESRRADRQAEAGFTLAEMLVVITIIGLIIAYIFRPAGLGVVFGLALFQVLLVLSTALPVWKKLRTGDWTDSEASEGSTTSDD